MLSPRPGGGSNGPRPPLRVLNPRLEPGPLLAEVHARLDDELDYQTEARYHHAFSERYEGHPFVRVPNVPSWWQAVHPPDFTVLTQSACVVTDGSMPFPSAPVPGIPSTELFGSE